MKPIALAACLFLILSCLSVASAAEITVTANIPIPIPVHYDWYDWNPRITSQTPFTVHLRTWESLYVTAIPSVTWEGRTYLFSGWNTKDFFLADFLQRRSGLKATTDATITVHYTLAGDANRDGIVNILDLLKVRSRMLSAADDTCYGEYDANRDGKLNILDLLYVRQHLGSKAPDME